MSWSKIEGHFVVTTEFGVFFIAQRYASAVYAVVVCLCGVDVAYRRLSDLGLSAVDIAQLAHTADEFILRS